jgi:hypothetical protein
LDSGGGRSALYLDIDASWNISPKTKFLVRYNRDLQYSAFATTGATPTNVYETVDVSIDKMLTRTVYLRLGGRFSWLRSDGEIVVVEPGADAVSAVRDDTMR